METSSRKKLGKIGILTKENAPDWFRILESHLRGERLWKVIQDVIEKRNRPIAAATAASSAPSPEAAATPGTVAETPGPPAASEESVNRELRELAEDDNWDAKNWKAITVISLLLSALDRHTVQDYQYAGDIWAYLKKFYEQSDRTA